MLLILMGMEMLRYCLPQGTATSIFWRRTERLKGNTGRAEDGSGRFEAVTMQEIATKPILWWDQGITECRRLIKMVMGKVRYWWLLKITASMSLVVRPERCSGSMPPAA